MLMLKSWCQLLALSWNISGWNNFTFLKYKYGFTRAAWISEFCFFYYPIILIFAANYYYARSFLTLARNPPKNGDNESQLSATPPGRPTALLETALLTAADSANHAHTAWRPFVSWNRSHERKTWRLRSFKSYFFFFNILSDRNNRCGTRFRYILILHRNVYWEVVWRHWSE